MRTAYKLLTVALLAIVVGSTGTQARFLSPDTKDPTQTGVGTNRYSYALQDPINKSDPSGHAAETPFDLLSLGIGIDSFAKNVAAGNYGSALVDVVGIGFDAAATVAPAVPGGASMAIAATRSTWARQSNRIISRFGNFQQHHVIPRSLTNHPLTRELDLNLHSRSNLISLPVTKADRDLALKKGQLRHPRGLHNGNTRAHRRASRRMQTLFDNTLADLRAGRIDLNEARSRISAAASRERQDLRRGRKSFGNEGTKPGAGSKTSESGAKNSSGSSDTSSAKHDPFSRD